MPDQLDSNQSFDDRTQEIKATIKSLFEDFEIDELEIPSFYIENNWALCLILFCIVLYWK